MVGAVLAPTRPEVSDSKGDCGGGGVGGGVCRSSLVSSGYVSHQDDVPSVCQERVGEVVLHCNTHITGKARYSLMPCQMSLSNQGRLLSIVRAWPECCSTRRGWMGCNFHADLVQHLAPPGKKGVDEEKGLLAV